MIYFIIIFVCLQSFVIFSAFRQNKLVTELMSIIQWIFANIIVYYRHYEHINIYWKVFIFVVISLGIYKLYKTLKSIQRHINTLSSTPVDKLINIYNDKRRNSKQVLKKMTDKSTKYLINKVENNIVGYDGLLNQLSYIKTKDGNMNKREAFHIVMLPTTVSEVLF